jgi:hypothetical protein
VRWILSILLSDALFAFLNGDIHFVGRHLSELLHWCFLLRFEYNLLSRHLIQALKEERRLSERFANAGEVSVRIPGAGVIFQAETMNRSTGGIMLATGVHVKKYVVRDTLLTLENNVYRVVWNRVKGCQFQLGLCRYSR